MKNRTPSNLDAQELGRTRGPVELTEAQAEQVSGGLNPQPLPPGRLIEGIWLSDHWNR